LIFLAVQLPKKEKSRYICTPFEKDGFDSVAQLVEHNTFNVRVLGSSPSGITEKASYEEAFFVYIIRSFEEKKQQGREVHPDIDEQL
jgi:hypothetical protein